MPFSAPTGSADATSTPTCAACSAVISLPVGSLRLEPELLVRLLSLLAARSGALTAFNRLAGELEVDGKTVKDQAGILEELFLVRRLRPWSRNLGSRHVRRPSSSSPTPG